MKIYFQNSIRWLSSLCCLPDIKIAWITLIMKDHIVVMFPFTDINCSRALKSCVSKFRYFRLIWFYKNVSLCSVTTRLIPYDLCVAVVVKWQWLTFCFCRYVSLTKFTFAQWKLLFVLIMFPNILPVYFLLMCKVSNPNFCLFKFAKRLFHWKTIIILSLLYLCFLLLLHGDTESKLYPRNSKNHLPSFCQWNLNSLPEYNFAEMVFFKHMMLCI